MSWARYDDEFPMNRKVGRLLAQGKDGLAAIGLHVLANTYCRHNGTAGHVEAHVPTLLCGGAHGRKLARMLEEVGMFDVDDEGGWWIHDYDEYHDPSDPNPNRSAADRKKELSVKRAEAGRRGGVNSGETRRSKPEANGEANTEANGEAKGKQTRTPVPGPVPVPSVPNTLSVCRPATTGQDDDDDRILQALRWRAWAVAQTSDKPVGYARKVLATDMAERRPKAQEYLDAHPDATAEDIAMYALGVREIDVMRAKEAA